MSGLAKQTDIIYTHDADNPEQRIESPKLNATQLFQLLVGQGLKN